MRKAFVILLCVLLGMSIALNFYQYAIRIERYEDIVSDTITGYDTIPHIKPTPTDSALLGYVTAKLPVSVPKLQNNALKFPKSSEKLQDSVDDFSNNVPNFNFGEEVNFPTKTDDSPDSINVKIPITQKVYKDSTYKAFVSGYKASLDSFYIYPQTKIITIREKPKRWHIGITAGYGITPKGFQPYLGLGCTYTFISF